MMDRMMSIQADLRQKPDDALAWAEYGALLGEQNERIRGLNALRQAVALDPNNADLVMLYANALSHIGRADEAMYQLQTFQEASFSAVVQNQLLRTSLALPDVVLNTLAEKSAEWHQQAAYMSLGLENAVVPALGDGRIRLAYFSSNLTEAAAGRFLIANLTHQDRGAFELTVLHDGLTHDSITEQLRSLADHWVETAAGTDEEFVAALQARHIQVIVDLDGHGGKRGHLFLKRGPMLVLSWLGGAAFFDANLIMGDGRLYKPENDSLYSGKLVRLPFADACWTPPDNAPSFPVLPSNAGNGVVFGSVNSVSALNDNLLRCWAAILQRMPVVHLLMVDPLLRDEGVAANTKQRLIKAGIPESCIRLQAAMTTDERLAQFQHIDVLLDTFPFSQRTATCESLWMGVPVVTLRGDRPWQNIGTSIVAAAGFPDLSAVDEASYVEQALSVVCNTFQRQIWRWTMRNLVKHSPLCAGILFVNHFQLQIQQYWQFHQPSLPSPEQTSEDSA